MDPKKEMVDWFGEHHWNSFDEEYRCQQSVSDPNQVLQYVFSSVHCSGAIAEAAKELMREGYSWYSRRECELLRRQDLRRSVEEFREFDKPVHCPDIAGQLEKLSRFLDIDLVPEEMGQDFLRMIFIAAFAALEAFLSDVFNYLISDELILVSVLDEQMKPLQDVTGKRKPQDKSRLKQFMTNWDLVSMASSHFSATEYIRTELSAYANGLTWHDLPNNALPLLRAAGVSLDKRIGGVEKEVQTRHDIVHRNGRTSKGEEIELSRDRVCELIDKIRSLGAYVTCEARKRWSEAPGESVDGPPP